MAVALRRKHLFQFYWCGSAPFFKAHLLSMVLDDFEKMNVRLQVELLLQKRKRWETKCEAYYKEKRNK